MDTLLITKTKGATSSWGHTCAQLFVTDKGYVFIALMKRQSEVLMALKEFTKHVGAPDMIISNGAMEQQSKALRSFLNDIGTTLKVLERGTPSANKAELYIGLIKEATRKDMKESDSPLVFWDSCLERRMMIQNLTAKDLFQLHGSNPHTELTGDDGDISNLCAFAWYQWFLL